jgi:hypothetical protein
MEQQLKLATIRTLASSAGEFFALLSSLCAQVAESLTELERMREAAKRGFQPLYFQDFIGAITQTDPTIAEALLTATVDRFEMGHLSITVGEDLNCSCLAMFGRERLKTALRETYGVEFKVRIRQGR